MTEHTKEILARVIFGIILAAAAVAAVTVVRYVEQRAQVSADLEYRNARARILVDTLEVHGDSAIVMRGTARWKTYKSPFGGVGYEEYYHPMDTLTVRRRSEDRSNEPRNRFYNY